MMPNVSVRTYKPRQQLFSKEKPRKRFQFPLHLSVEQGKIIGVVFAVALVISLALTQFFHGQLSSMQAQAEILQARNNTIANENIRLLASRAQVASKTHIAALAKTKLKLFEPDQGQVRRM